MEAEDPINYVDELAALKALQADHDKLHTNYCAAPTSWPFWHAVGRGEFSRAYRVLQRKWRGESSKDIVEKDRSDSKAQKDQTEHAFQTKKESLQGRLGAKERELKLRLDENARVTDQVNEINVQSECAGFI